MDYAIDSYLYSGKRLNDKEKEYYLNLLIKHTNWINTQIQKTLLKKYNFKLVSKQYKIEIFYKQILSNITKNPSENMFKLISAKVINTAAKNIINGQKYVKQTDAIKNDTMEINHQISQIISSSNMNTKNMLNEKSQIISNGSILNNLHTQNTSKNKSQYEEYLKYQEETLISDIHA